MNNLGGIIIEGAEQQGKTTFINDLNKLLNFKVIHMTKDYGKINGIFDYRNGYFMDIKEPIIFDRNYLSELVYGEFFNRNNIDETERFVLEKKFLKLNYLLVLLDKGNNNWVEREEQVTREENAIIKELYLKHFNKSILTKIIVNPFLENSINIVYSTWKIINS